MRHMPASTDPSSESPRHPRLPNPTSTLPWWRTEPHPLDEFRSSDKVPDIVDVAIIGAGMSGACAAYHLLSGTKPYPSIAIFEARQACSGATGRNGGHARLSPFYLTEFLAAHGPAETLNLALFLKQLLREMKECAENVNVLGQLGSTQRTLAEECEMLATRSWDVFQDESHARDVEMSWKRAMNLIRNVAQQEGREEDVDWLGEVQFLKGAYVENITSIRGAKAAMSSPALSFWPYKFVLGLLQHVLDLGAQLYTLTPVTRMEKVVDQEGAGQSSANDRGLTALYTDRGITLAKKVVLATNAYVSSLLSLYDSTVIPVRGTACHIIRQRKEGSDRDDICTTEHEQLINTYNIHAGPTSREYLNPRPDGSIIMGGGQPLFRDNKEIWYDSVDDGTLIDHVKERWFEGYMGRHFRGWKQDGQSEHIDYTWTGIMGSTEDSLPHVGVIPGEASHFILAGFNGSGMSLIYVVSRGIARMIQEGITFEETGLPRFFKTVPGRITGNNGS